MSDKGHQFTYDVDRVAIDSNFDTDKFYNFDVKSQFSKHTIDQLGQPNVKEVFVRDRNGKFHSIFKDNKFFKD
jgi:hypothetical protein